jgi:hypothetical protein
MPGEITFMRKMTTNHNSFSFFISNLQHARGDNIYKKADNKF